MRHDPIDPARSSGPEPPPEFSGHRCERCQRPLLATPGRTRRYCPSCQRDVDSAEARKDTSG